MGDRPVGEPPPPRGARNEALLVWGGVTALCAALYWVGMGLPVVKSNL